MRKQGGIRPEDTGDPRPSWEEYFISIAMVVAGRSTCLRRQVGAIVVKDRRILTTGYNGVPRGLAHCCDVGCLRELVRAESGHLHELCRGLHAEQNAIIQGALYGVSLEGGELYSTHEPCVLCTKMLISAGIKSIYFIEPYPDELARQMLSEAGIHSARVEFRPYQEPKE